jgi:hypothetical protein
MIFAVVNKKSMSTKHYTKIVHEGNYVAQVDVGLIYADEGCSPYLALEDAYRLDDVREALKRGDLKAASKLGRIYKLTRVAGRERTVPGANPPRLT